MRVSDLDGERYLNPINCEQVNLAHDVFARHGTKVERVYRGDRDDWIVAMVAAGLGFGFMPQYSIAEHPDVVVRPLIEPEFWREVSLVTVRGRPHSPAIGALVRDAMRMQWCGAPALAVQQARARNAEKMHLTTREKRSFLASRPRRDANSYASMRAQREAQACGNVPLVHRMVRFGSIR